MSRTFEIKGKRIDKNELQKSMKYLKTARLSTQLLSATNTTDLSSLIINGKENNKVIISSSSLSTKIC